MNDATERPFVAIARARAQIKEMKLSGAWMSGTPTLKVFGVMSQRVGKYITMQVCPLSSHNCCLSAFVVSLCPRVM